MTYRCKFCGKALDLLEFKDNIQIWICDDCGYKENHTKLCIDYKAANNCGKVR